MSTYGGIVVVVVVGGCFLTVLWEVVLLFPRQFCHVTELCLLLLEYLILVLIFLKMLVATTSCLLLLRRFLLEIITGVEIAASNVETGSSAFAGARIAVPKQARLPCALEVLRDRQIIRVLPVPKRRYLAAPFVVAVVPLLLTHNVIF